MIRRSLPWVVAAAAAVVLPLAAGARARLAQEPARDRALIQAVLDATTPLEEPRGDRLPLYVWPAHRLGTVDPQEIERRVRDLEARGMAAIATWKPHDPDSLGDALRLGEIQKRLGLPLSVNATACTYAFFNGDPRTAHVDAEGRPFFDASFGAERKMGCPFAVDFRLPEMRRRIEVPVLAYEKAGLAIRFLYADWEIDGPLEWNGAWESSKRCVRCRASIPDIEEFGAFQKAIREKRSELLRRMLAEPVRSRFPQALVGNYAVYPHDGYRYWYDYFEKTVEGAPHKTEGRARYRRWFHEFPLTGLTAAMPVVYPWYAIYGWYDFPSSDYRWFYNMLLVGTHAAESAPAGTPLVTFVHRRPVAPPPQPDPAVRPLSVAAYKELLWHLLLRGHDALFLWSPREEAVEESRLVQEVYRDSHPYRDFLMHGKPLVFDVPREAGPVVSAVEWGRQVLVRRTDFDDRRASPVALDVGGRKVWVPRRPGEVQIFDLEPKESR